MITYNDIEAMDNFEMNLKFALPDDIAGIDKTKIIEFNRIRYSKEIKNDFNDIEHSYSNIDFTLSYYYLSCSIHNLISKNDFFILIKSMIVEYESISFVSLLSDESKYFSIKACNEIFDYLYRLFPLCKSDNAYSNLRAYFRWMFEDGFKWNDGVFRINMLNEKNKSLFLSLCLDE